MPKIRTPFRMKKRRTAASPGPPLDDIPVAA
jgi:hypothetical protein